MNCPYCNSDLAARANFCPKCGNRIPDHMMEGASKSNSAAGTLIAVLVIFLVVAAGGVIGYLYFFAEPKREQPETKIYNDPAPAKPVEKDQEVPMPDEGSSKQQQQEVNSPDTAPPNEQQKEITTPDATPKDDSETSGPMRITSDVAQPVLIHKVNPEYPEIARKARIQGVVILEAVINRDGTVENVKVLRGVHPILDQVAINSVQQWRYKPATLNGKPVKVYFTITVKFTLK